MYEQIFGEYPQVKVINYILGNSNRKYTKKQIAYGANISRVTLNSFFDDLVDLGIIIKKGSYYHVNYESRVVQILLKTQVALANTIMKEDIENVRVVLAEAVTDEEFNKFMDSFDYEVDIDEEIKQIENKHLTIQSGIVLQENSISKNINTARPVKTDISINGCYINKNNKERMINYG